MALRARKILSLLQTPQLCLVSLLASVKSPRKSFERLTNSSGLTLPTVLLLAVVAIIIVLIVFPYIRTQYHKISSDPKPTTRVVPPDGNHQGSVADTIRFSNSTSEKGILVNGEIDGSFRTFYPNPPKNVLTGTKDLVSFGNFLTSPPGKTGEVIAFAEDKVPALKEKVQWSEGSDTVEIRFSEPIRVPLVFWVVATPIVDSQGTILDAEVQRNIYTGPDGHCEIASRIWRKEGRGIVLDDNCGPFQDVSNKQLSILLEGRNRAAKDYFAETVFSCSDHGELIKNVGWQDNAINVYIVNKVSSDNKAVDSAYNAVWCRSHRIVVMGAETNETVLAHELGHAFSLEHINDMAPRYAMPDCPSPTPPSECTLQCLFDRMNTMHSSSSCRESLSDGQVFRTFFNSRSEINQLSLKDIGSNAVTGPGKNLNRVRDCEQNMDTNNDGCPPIQKRLWLDRGEAKNWEPN